MGYLLDSIAISVADHDWLALLFLYLWLIYLCEMKL